MNFDHGSSENVITKSRLEQEKINAQLRASGTPDPDSLTVVQYFSNIKYLDERSRIKSNGQKNKFSRSI